VIRLSRVIHIIHRPYYYYYYNNNIKRINVFLNFGGYL